MSTSNETELAALRAENERLREKVAEYEGSINWFTTCTSCADVLDASYRTHVEAGQAKERLAAVIDMVDDAADLADYVLVEKLGNEATLQSCRDLRAKARAVLRDADEEDTVPAQTYATLAESKLRIESDWLVQEVDEHTCGTDRGGHYGAHEPGCGLEPVLDLSVLPGWVGTREPEALIQAVSKEVWDRTRDTFAVRSAEAALRKALQDG